ncbi:MAG TPA: ABC transporter permease [Ktedonobacterales bacterium]|nr:ABC transporter permease [Ktedonobacterales bacterium]
MSTAERDEVAAARRTALRRRVTVNVLRVAALVVTLGAWELGTRTCSNPKDTSTCIIDKFFWGQPTGVWQQIVQWVQQGTSQGPLWEQIAVTLEEAGIGFLIGVVLGVIFGVVLGRNRFLADVLGPYIKAANSIPRVVLGALFAISWGVVGLQSKIALAVVLVFFVVFFNAFQGVREADRNLLANARILGANQWQLTRAVIIPSALTWIIASLHISFSFAVVGAVVGEFLGSVKGVGLLIRVAQLSFNANGVFAAMAILAALTLTAEFLITWLENRLIRWRPSATTEATL